MVEGDPVAPSNLKVGKEPPRVAHWLSSDGCLSRRLFVSSPCHANAAPAARQLTRLALRFNMLASSIGYQAPMRCPSSRHSLRMNHGTVGTLFRASGGRVPARIQSAQLPSRWPQEDITQGVIVVGTKESLGPRMAASYGCVILIPAPLPWTTNSWEVKRDTYHV
jgi:hypothetical protein